MTGKERAAWRAKANSLEPLFQVGKGGISDALIKQTDDALRTRELIKLKVLRGAEAKSGAKGKEQKACRKKSKGKAL